MNKKISRKTITIIPSDLATSKPDFDRRMARILPISRSLHIDIMDGKFVKTKSIAVNNLPDLRRFSNRSFEAHLMVEDPGRYVDTLLDKGIARIIIHAESLSRQELVSLAKKIRSCGGKPVLAINPTTKVSSVKSVLQMFDGLLIMGVFPGKNGSPYVRSTPRRVRTAEKIASSMKKYVQVDGGMTPQTIGSVVVAGATRIVSGSYIGSAENPAHALREMRLALKEKKKR